MQLVKKLRYKPAVHYALFPERVKDAWLNIFLGKSNYYFQGWYKHETDVASFIKNRNDEWYVAKKYE